MRYFKKFGDVVYEFTGMFPGRGDLLRDGWLEYSGVLPAERVGIEDGSIVELPEPEVVPPVRILSRLKIRDTLTAAGLWSPVKEALEQFGEYERFILANEIREDDPGFVAMIDRIKAMPEAAGVDVELVLSQCVV